MLKIFKIGLFALLSAIFIAFASSHVFAIDADVYEPDNNFTAANAIPTNGSLQHHSFHIGGDEDWIKFNVTNETFYIIKTTNLLNNADTFIFLYDSDGTTLIDSDDDGGDGLASKIAYQADANETNYVKIRHFSSSGTGNYSIYVKEAQKDQYEPDDDYTQANAIRPNGTGQVHNFVPSNDTDFVKFNASTNNESSKIAYFAEASSFFVEPTIQLIGQDGVTTLQQDGEELIFNMRENGTYFLKLFQDIQEVDNDVGNYSISILQIVDPSDKYEPDDNYTLATEIPINGTVQTHNFFPGNDEDWIQFNTTNNNKYVIETSNLDDVNTLIYLYDSDGTTLIDSDDDGGDGLASKIGYLEQSEGTKYVRVVDLEGDILGTYDISINEITIPKDQYEPDDNFTLAKDIGIDGLKQNHTTHKPNDFDFMKFNAVSSKVYIIETSNLLGSTDTVISLFDSDQNLIIRDDNSGNEFRSSKIVFQATQDGLYYINATSSFLGQDYGQYDISVSETGFLEVSLTSPTTNITVEKNSLFTVASRITCKSEFCGNVTAILDPHEESPKGKKIIDYDIKLKSRKFNPLDAESIITTHYEDENQQIEYLIQFWDIPSQEEIKRLESEGITLLDYIPENTFVARMTNANYEDLINNNYGNVRAITILEAQDKIESTLKDGHFTDRTLNPDGTLNLIIELYENVDMEDLTNEIHQKGAELIEFDARTNIGLINANTDNFADIATSNKVKSLSQLYEQEILNDGIRERIGVNDINNPPHSLDGTGIVVAEWDGGWADFNHQDLKDRITVGDFGCSESECFIRSHATHVAGTVLGNGSLSEAKGGQPLQWRGMAPKANLISYEWWGETPNEVTDEYMQALDIYKAGLSTNSWGFRFSFGNYDINAKIVDEIVVGNLGRRIPQVWAAGNSGRSGFNTISSPATAKNVITIGASNSDTDAIASFSSLGPTDDGRIKPDIVAPGCQISGDGGITSTFPENIYSTICGTSMATPAAAGSIALILQKVKELHPGKELLPSSIKSLLITSALDLGNKGPDFTYGYGRINVTNAVDIIDNLIEDSFSQNGEASEYELVIEKDLPALKVTLVWDDVPAAVLASKTLVNDLDMVLIDPEGNVHLPWVIDPQNPTNLATKDVDSTNNVEQVEVENPEKGRWKIRVIASILPFPQDFSITSNAEIQTEKGTIPMNSGTPFYTLDQNPVFPENLSCLVDIQANGICDTTWAVNVTGPERSKWKFFVIYDNNVSLVKTEDIFVTIAGPPALNPITITKEAVEDEIFSFNVTAIPSTNPGMHTFSTDNNTKYTVTKLSDTKAKISFTPTNNDVPSATLTVFVTDSQGLTDSEQVTMQVNNTNDAPIIVSVHTLYSNPKIHSSKNITFNVTASDPDEKHGDVLITTWYLNSKINSTGISFAFNPDGKTGTNNILANVTDKENASVTREWALTVAEKPIANTFDPSETTDFSNITNLSNVKDVTLGKEKGKISFKESLDLRFVVDLDNLINISEGFIQIDTSQLSELNKSATLVMKNLQFARTPKILVDDGSGFKECSSDLCANVIYENNILTFDVAHFSAYKAVEDVLSIEESKLGIKNIKVRVDDDLDKVRDGDDVNDIKPGSKLRITVEVGNLFENEKDIEIEDIGLEVTILDIDDGNDLDKDADLGDLEPGDDDFASLVFDMPLNVEERKYRVEVEVKGVDNSVDRNVHEIGENFFLDIEKENHELIINKYKLIGPVSCNARTGLDLELINTGSNDEDEVVLTVESPDISLNFRQELELEEGEGEDDDSSIYSESIPVTVSNQIVSGTYPVYIKAYYDSTTLSDEKTADLFVRDCEEEKSEAIVLKANSMDSPKAEVFYAQTRQTASTVSTKEIGPQSFFDQEFILAILISVHIALIGLIILLVGYYARK